MVPSRSRIAQPETSIAMFIGQSARARRTISLALILVGSGGCGDNLPYDLAPVSGIVTLEGEPLAGATVKFAPQGGMGKELVGPGSIGTTDETGRYELRTYKEQPGAVVGVHKVKISTRRSEYVDIRKSDELRVVSEERVPKHYHKKSILSFKVPPEGTDKADFMLTLEKPD